MDQQHCSLKQVINTLQARCFNGVETRVIECKQPHTVEVAREMAVCSAPEPETV